MTVSSLLLVLFSLTELALLAVIVFFFVRLKKSEALLSRIQSNQESFLKKLQFNAQIEQELVDSFEKRQTELAALDQEIQHRVDELKTLLKRAREYSRSPKVLRQIIIAGHESGKSPRELAQDSGLSVEEVELIIDQAG